MKPITTHPYDSDLLVCPYYFWNCKTPDLLQKFHSGDPVYCPYDAEKQFQALLSIVQANKKLFSLICTTIPTLQGWCGLEKACALASLTLAMKPIHACELGVYAGRSLLGIAFAMKEIGSGLITGIDPYSPQESASGQIGANEKWWGELDHQSIKKKFLDVVKLFKLENHVRLIEKASSKVDTSNMQLQILHVDANHGENAFHDAEKYGPLVQLGGLVICDDLGWELGGVLRAVDALEEMGFVEVLRRTEGGENWNLMQRIK